MEIIENRLRIMDVTALLIMFLLNSQTFLQRTDVLEKYDVCKK